MLYPKPASEPPSPTHSRASTPAVSDDENHEPVRFGDDDNPTDDEEDFHT